MAECRDADHAIQVHTSHGRYLILWILLGASSGYSPRSSSTASTQRLLKSSMCASQLAKLLQVSSVRHERVPNLKIGWWMMHDTCDVCAFPFVIVVGMAGIHTLTSHSCLREVSCINLYLHCFLESRSCLLQQPARHPLFEPLP